MPSLSRVLAALLLCAAAVVAVVYFARDQFRATPSAPAQKTLMKELRNNSAPVTTKESLKTADPHEHGGKDGFTLQNACYGCCTACSACSSYCTCDSCDTTSCYFETCTSGGSSDGGSSGGCWEFPVDETCPEGEHDQVHPFKTGSCLEILNLETGKSTCFEEDHLVKLESKWMLAREITSDKHFKVIGERTSTRLSACWFGGSFQGKINGFQVATYPLISPEMVRATVPTWLIKAFNAIFHYY